MPTLTVTKTYLDGDVLTEADLDAIRTSIQTFVNTTKLDDSNLQDAGITRATKLKVGTVNHVLINAADGTMSSEAALSQTRGGTGLGLSLTIADAGKTLVVNPAGSAFALTTAAETPLSKVFAFNNFT